MLVKTIKYTDFNDVEREEKFMFNLTQAELLDMQLGTTGGLTELISKIIEEKDLPKIQEYFKSIILKAYGVKSDDGKKFIKIDKDGTPLSIEFSQSAAYSVLYMELATDANKAIEFIKGIMPSGLDLPNIDPDKLASGNVEEITALIEDSKK